MIFSKIKYFTFGQYLFWLLILLFLSFILFNLADKIFKEKGLVDNLVKRELNPAIDTTSNIISDTTKNKKDYLKYDWKWNDFEGNFHSISFQLHKDDLEKARNNRVNSYEYNKLYQHDKKILKDLIDKLKIEIKNNNLKFPEAIELVCSSIQFIPYTLILAQDGICPCNKGGQNYSAYCKVQADGRGCCSQILPFGVFSPLEFVCLKTGDCDTRALLAFTFLKEMGFDVAVMVSHSRHHSVLGVYLPDSRNYSYGKNSHGKKYALWELTNPHWRLGMKVSGHDWVAALE